MATVPSPDHGVAPASDYDEFVNWEKRLGNESPFFRSLFEGAGVRRVLDIGAGSARHAIMFASWGLDVVAVDPDDSMLAQAHANQERFADTIEAGGGTLEIVKAGFGEVSAHVIGRADAVVCLGNALPHVEGREGLAEALEDFASALVPGGLLVLHLLNHQRLLEHRQRVIPPKIISTAEGDRVFLRVIDYPEGDEYLDFDFVTLERDRAGSWSLANRRSPHTALPLPVLMAALDSAGFTGVEAFGGHDRHALGGTDESVLLVARRA